MRLGTGLGFSRTGSSAVSLPAPLTMVPEFWVAPSDTSSFSLSATSVDSYTDPSGNAQSFTGASTARPTLSGGVLTFDGSNDVLTAKTGPTFLSYQTMPDATYGGPIGHGFTCTGLCRMPDGTWAVGNHGKTTEAASYGESYNPSIVFLSSGFATKVGEIGLFALYPSCGSVQGVTLDTTDNTLWFVSVEEGIAHHISSAGAALSGDITVGASASGCAYNPNNDSLFVLYTTGDIKEFSCSTGTQLQSISIGYNDGLDHLFYDAAKNVLWYDWGTNNSQGYLRFYDLTNGFKSQSIPVENSLTIEGFAIEGNNFYALNDSYYHPSTPNYNRADTDKFTGRISTDFDLNFVLSIPSAPSGYDGCIFSHGDTDSASGFAVTVVNGTTNQIKFLFRDANGTTGNCTFTLPTTLLNTYSQLRVIVNLATRRVRLYQNGAYVGVKSFGTTTNPRILGINYYIGGDSDGRYLAMNLKDFALYATELSDTQYGTLGQYFATKHGLSFTLDIVGPEYKVPGLSATWNFGKPSAVTQTSNAIDQIADPVGGKNLTSTGAARPAYSAANGSATFDGVDDVLSGSAFMFAQGANTVVAVMKSDGGSNKYLLSEGNSGATGQIYGLIHPHVSNANDDMYAYVRDDAATIKFYDTNSLKTGVFDNTKQVVTVTDTGTAFTGYKNGVVGSTHTYNRTGTFTFNTLAMGALKRTTTGNNIAAEVFEVHVYNRVLSAGEITELTNALRSKHGI